MKVTFGFLSYLLTQYQVFILPISKIHFSPSYHQFLFFFVFFSFQEDFLHESPFFVLQEFFSFYQISRIHFLFRQFFIGFFLICLLSAFFCRALGTKLTTSPQGWVQIFADSYKFFRHSFCHFLVNFTPY